MTGLTVIIPTLDAARHLSGCLDAFGATEAIIVADGGSSDATAEIAARHGATFAPCPCGRGPQLIAGAAIASTEWLLFVHADTVLDPGWRTEVATFTANPANRERAAVFVFALDDASKPARRLQAMVRWRSRALALPYGDQGILIHRELYDSLGGYRPWAMMEDVDMIRRIGRRRLAQLNTRAVTSADRWRREGWTRRSARNIGCLALYYLGLPPRHIQKLYG